MRPKRTTITRYAERPSWRSQWAFVGAAALLATALALLSAMMLLEGAGGSGVEVVFFGVARPLSVKQLVQRLQDLA